jgi:hypothetical protein
MITRAFPIKNSCYIITGSVAKTENGQQGSAICSSYATKLNKDSKKLDQIQNVSFLGILDLILAKHIHILAMAARQFAET